MTRYRLPRPLSSNGLFTNAPGRGRVKTKRYRDWIATAGYSLLEQDPKPVRGPVRVHLFVEDKGAGDLDNRAKAVIDLLVSHGVIDGDDRKTVRSVSLFWSPNVTGCEVMITPDKMKEAT